MKSFEERSRELEKEIKQERLRGVLFCVAILVIFAMLATSAIFFALHVGMRAL